MLIFLSIIGGFLILTFGAEALVRGASTIALRLGIAPLVIGLTIVAFGTSAPELAVSLESALNEKSGIALGNVIGSNIANIGLILAITALIKPIKIQSQVVKRDIPLMIGVTLLFWGLLLDGELDIIDGSILFALLVGYLSYSYYDSKKTGDIEEVPEGKEHPIISFLLIIFGIAMLIGGGIIFVDGAVDLAKYFGISEVIIGLTVVAIGTSMPELATAVVAARRGQSDLAIGNVIGSNLFNILAVLGITAIIHPISGDGLELIDFAVMLLLAVIMLPFAYTGMRISRQEGTLLLLIYLAYNVYLVSEAIV
ncbi:sodium:calcium antiporter [Parashewanella spongiae]|uniref:Sodium:calcium antiporter n=1 Tax=Parashewanella spongiae TaxID=342950 RepID=A0A3A6TXB8_9GAMM|nr:calcium/sodium antiporter [Parashewanella spongiae]MCL1078585.1 calcium/sodium antiporter [Parashewanella spongiae]RJY13115.1 sodium:calcium antiporter [Parashewanella spongiae]